MNVIKHSLTFTATASTSIATSTSYLHGRILAVQYIASTSAAISTTADLTITTENSSQNILNSLAVTGSFMKAPRLRVVNTTNGSIANEAGYIPVADERFKVKISKTTSTGQTGVFNVWTG